MVFVAHATPIGVARTISWVAEQRGVVDALTLRVVLNHAPRDRFRRRELEHELVRTAGVAGVSFVPSDPRVEHAVWDGTVVRRGPFADATARAAEALVARRTEPVRTPMVRGAASRRGAARRAAGRRAGWAA